MSQQLTGSARVRLVSRLFRKPLLVLQVEVKERKVESLGGWVDTYTVKYWRDATIEEISAFSLNLTMNK